MRPRNSIFIYLLWFSFAVALPLFGIIGYGIYERFVNERGEALATIKHARELGESRVGNSFSRSRAILETIADGIDVQGLDVEKLHGEFAPLLRQRPEFKDIALVDAQGTVLVAEGNYFNAAGAGEIEAALRAPSFSFGRPFRASSQEFWHTIVSVPIQSRSMRLVVHMDLSGLSDRLLSTGSANRPAVSVLGPDGVVLLRSREIEELIGLDLPNFDAIAEVVRDGIESGTFIGLDGKHRTYSARFLPNTGLFVIASVPTDEITAGARAGLRNNIVALLFVTSLVLAIAYRFSLLISRPITRLADAVRNRADGGSKVQASVEGPAEVADTAKAFNEMVAARDASEAARIEGEKRLDLAVAGADLGLWDCDLRRGETTYNEHYARMLGFATSEIKSSVDSWRARIHPDDRQRISEQAEKLVAGEHSSFQSEYRLQKKNGDWIWILDRGRIVEWDDEGHAVRAAGTHLDITERKNAEEALANSEERYRFIVRNTGQIAYDADLITDEMEWFGAIEEILGWKPEEFRSVDIVSFTNHIHPDDREGVIASYAKCCASGVPFNAEYRVLTKTGETRMVDDYGVFTRDRNGNPVRNYGRIIDVTERHAVQQELLTAKNRFQGIVNSIDGIVWEAEAEAESLCFTFVSQQADRLTGYPASEWTGNPEFLEKHVHEEDRGWLPRFLRGTITLRKDHDVEFRIVAADGRTIWFQASITVVEHDGTVTMLRGVMLDVTERKVATSEKESLNRKLQETQKLESLGVLAGGIAHDFNNLLTGVLGNASLARLDMPEESPTLVFLDQIEKAAMRAADLCKQMLAYSGRGRFQIRRIDLNTVLQETTQLLEVSVSKKASLQFKLAGSLPPVMADVTQLRQVVMNLVINASEAMGGSGGTITTTTSVVNADREYIAQSRFSNTLAPGPYVLLEISDTGCGMSKETVSKIFDPFFTTKFTGRGLGLSAVLGIIRGHNGTIKVYSELGKGTTFKILLPVAEGPIEKKDDAMRAGSEWRGSGRALVVDDEAGVRSVAAGMLTALGFTVTITTNGSEGLTEFQKDPASFALVLLDLTMPVMEGEEAFRRMRGQRPDTKVILMSGFNQQEANARFIGQGLAGFVQKPFDFDSMSAEVRRVFTGE